MTPRRARRLLFAPALIVLDAATAALRALTSALIIEHFLADTEARDDPPVRRKARAVLRNVRDLRRALAAYRRAVDDALRHPPDLPF